MLIFASMRDRVAVVIADEKVAAQIHSPAWDDAIADLVSGMRTRQRANGFVAAIASCGVCTICVCRTQARALQAIAPDADYFAPKSPFPCRSTKRVSSGPHALLTLLPRCTAGRVSISLAQRTTFV